jgi:hypothetical protein
MAVVDERSTNGHHPPASRVIGRRRPVPNPRVLIGAVLVAGAAVLVFAAWLGATGSPGRPWVVARVPLAAGSQLAAGDLTTARMRLAPATAAGATGDVAALVGRTLAAPLAPGDLVTAAALVPSGAQPALRPVAVTVDPSEVADLGTGGLADVLVTDGSSPPATTTIVVRGARVLSTGAPAAGLVGGQSGAVVTLGVGSFAEVTAIIHAEQTGTVAVVAGEPSDGTGLGPS